MDFSDSESVRTMVSHDTGAIPLIQALRNFRKMSGEISTCAPLPVKPIELTGALTYTWQNVTVKAPRTFKKFPPRLSKPKTLIQGVAGLAHPGELLAIMGASGTGKTTLLNTLVFKSMKTKVEGEFRINGFLADKHVMTMASSYVPQQDIFFWTLTPREQLFMQAALRLGRKFTQAEKAIRVNAVIRQLGLTKCADTKIGRPTEGNGISGGQRKRLSVAEAIIKDSRIIAFDEPTTGLDSYSTSMVLGTMQKLKNLDRTIIVSIHQPNSLVYACFDKVIFMAEGRVVFFGKPKDALKLFKKLGYPCPLNYNPADHIMSIIAIRPYKRQECVRRCEEITLAYMDLFYSNYLRQIDEVILKYLRTESFTTMPSDIIKTEAKIVLRLNRSSWLKQYRWCIWRFYKHLIRNPRVFFFKFLKYVLSALFLSGTYYHQNKDMDGVQNINGVLAIILCFLALSSMIPVLHMYWETIDVLLKDVHDRLYRLDAYFLALTTVELPEYILLPGIHATICYFLIGLQFDDRWDGTKFFQFNTVNVLVANIGVSYGLLCATICNSFEESMNIALFIICPFILVGGVFMHKDSISDSLYWFQQISYFLHANSALHIIQWRDVENITCFTVDNCLVSGKQILAGLGYKEDDYTKSVAILVFTLILVRILSFIGLLLKTR